MDESSAEWAAFEFGQAALGDPRRTRRLMGVAEALAYRPAGRITRAFELSADREGAYRLVETNRFSWADIARSVHAAAARRAARYQQIIVPVDAVAFSLV